MPLADYPVSAYLLRQRSPGHPTTAVTIDRMVQLDGSVKWAVRSEFREVLTKRGDWIYEPLPSSRTDAFLKRTRFDSAEDAAAAWEKYVRREQRRDRNKEPQ